VAVGLVSILGQVVLLRELNVAFYGSELIYVLALGLWLLWTAVGAMAGRRTTVPAAWRVRALLLAVSLVLPLSIVFIRAVRRIFGAVPGAYLPFPSQMLAMALALLPACVLLGLLFQWAAKRYVGQGRTLARAYAVESAGAIAGGALATLFLAAGVQNLQAGLLCGLTAAAAACLPWRRDRPRWLLPTTLVPVVLLLASLVWSGSLDRRLTGIEHPNLVASRDSPYGRVTVTALHGQRSVFVNDALAYESEGTDTEELVHLAALQHPAPRTVLVLGGVMEPILQEVRGHAPVAVDQVLLNRILFELAAPYSTPLPAHGPGRESFSLTVGDTRRFLERTSGVRYDLVLVAMPEPASGQDNRFYTREFFRLCKGRMAPGGVLAFRLRASENLWIPHLVRRNAAIHRALGEVFQDVLVLPGPVNIVIASDEPLARDPDILAARFRERRIEARLVSPGYIRYLLTNDRRAEIEEMMAASRVPANTDARPVCYQYTLLLWLSRFFPALAMMDLEMAGVAGGWLIAPVAAWLLLALALRWWPASRRFMMAAAAGFLGMVLETVLILNYQVRSGILYQDLGILLTLFMAGLAAGAAAMDRASRTGGGGAGLPRWTGAAVVGGLVLLNLLTAWLLQAGAVAGLAVTGLLLMAGGFLTAAAFAWASLHRVADQRAVVSPLYGADLLGGCAGSLLATLFLVPVAGLAGTALLLAAAAAGAILLI